MTTASLSSSTGAINTKQLYLAEVEVVEDMSNKLIDNVWQWRSPSNTWNDFPKDANDSVVEVFSKGKGRSVTVDLHGQL